MKPSPLLHESTIIDALPLAIAVVNYDQQLIAANKAAQEFFGFKAQIPDGKLLALCARVFRDGESITAHDFFLSRNGQEYRATIHISEFVNKQLLLTVDFKGEPHNPTASAWKNEITQAAGIMAAMLAHEVKNPLASIRGAAQLVAANITPSERPLIDLIISETLRIRDLLDQVEVFSDARKVESMPLNIHEILQYTIQLARAGFAGNINFVERYDPSLPLVMSHRDSLVQIMLNIMKNSAEALENIADPVIIISTSYQSGLKMTDKKLPIMVNISDNGSGISAEIRKKLFEPLNSRKAQGRGLGLSVVAKIASDLGIIVECDDRPPPGAGFTIYLPCA